MDVEETMMCQTVPVADDDKATRMLLRPQLERAGYLAVQASDGVRARTVLEDNPQISLPISDLLMPGIDGREPLAGLRREDRFRDLPVLMESATVGVGEVQRLLEAGASRFLPEPIHEKELVAEGAALTPRSAA